MGEWGASGWEGEGEMGKWLKRELGQLVHGGTDEGGGCADSYFSSPALPVESIRIGAVIGNLGDGWCACFCCQQQL